MKNISFYLLLLHSLFTFSQEDLLQKIDNLQKKIIQSQGISKPDQMDSLYQYTKEEKEQVNYTIIKEQINYAITIDTIPLAISYAKDHISYLIEELGQYKEAINFYEFFKERKIDITNLDQNSLKLLAQLQLSVGDAYYYSSKIKETIYFYEKAEWFALKAKDTAMHLQAKYYKGSSQADIGEYILASQAFKESAEIARKSKDSVQHSNAQNGLANIYSRMGFFKEAKVLRDEVTALNNHMHTYNPKAAHRPLFTALYNASIDAEKQGNQTLRIQLLKESLTHENEIKNTTVNKQKTICGLLRAYSEIGDIPKAKYYYDEIQKAFITQKILIDIPTYGEALIIYYIAIKDFENAKITARKQLELLKKSKNTTGIFETKEKLAEIYKALGDIETSYTYYEEAIKLKDSTQNVQKAQALAYYQTLYETEKRDFKITAQQNEIVVLDQKNKVKQQWIFFGGLSLLALFTIIYLIRSRNFTRTKQILQEQFSQNLISEQEKERTRLARELHDSVGQKLMLLSKKTEISGDQSAQILAANTLQELRSISRSLHPAMLENLGLTKAIESLINEVDANTSLFFTHQIDPIDHLLPKETTLHFYRIMQEILSNMVKHADAKTASITITHKENIIEAVIKDNGKGFDFSQQLKKQTSLGMKTLVERTKIINSKIDIYSTPNVGTKIYLNIPI
ncbi:sensor histidine kinase [Dokdonia sp.]|uniref:sensor histidine kinase n=1 Tax=Dokdonia sp. TaxID=2024995 RepID=UPI0032646496